MARFHGNVSSGGTANIKVNTIVANLTTYNGIFWANGSVYSTGGGGGGSFTGGSVSSTTYPSGNITIDLGTSSAYWRSTFTGNVVTTGGIYWANGSAYSTGGGGGGGSVSISDDTATATALYPIFINSNSGSVSTVSTSSTNLTYVPLTGTLNAVIFNSTSDATKKTNIETINNALAITEALRGVTFEFADTGVESAGLLAQDVEKYLPQLVTTTQNGKSLNYNGVIGILVEAVKTLSDRVKKLENK